MKVTAVLADGKNTEVSATGGGLSSLKAGDAVLARWSALDALIVRDDG